MNGNQMLDMGWTDMDKTYYRPIHLEDGEYKQICSKNENCHDK